MALNKDIFEISLEIQKELERAVAQSDANTKAGCVIARGNDILGISFAHKAVKESAVSDNPLLLVHAEEAALVDALNKNIDISEADIYVLLVRKNGEVRYTDGSYSCIVCSRLLQQTKIANVVYPTANGWEKITVQEMFDKAIKRIDVQNKHERTI